VPCWPRAAGWRHQLHGLPDRNRQPHAWRRMLQMPPLPSPQPRAHQLWWVLAAHGLHAWHLFCMLSGSRGACGMQAAVTAATPAVCARCPPPSPTCATFMPGVLAPALQCALLELHAPWKLAHLARSSLATCGAKPARLAPSNPSLTARAPPAPSPATNPTKHAPSVVGAARALQPAWVPLSTGACHTAGGGSGVAGAAINVRGLSSA